MLRAPSPAASPACWPCCDPHRPRRVGAAGRLLGYPVPPTSTGCDPHRPRRVGAARRSSARRARRRTVAILTDPGGSVLRTGTVTELARFPWLRSSPTPEGRCCVEALLGGPAGLLVAILTDPGGSVLPDRAGPPAVGAEPCRCDPHRPRRVGAALPRVGHHAARYDVAILTDPGGSVLPIGRRRAGWSGGWWLRSSPTPEGRCCPRSTPTTTCRASSSCDPHRPRRVGAACLTYGSWPAANSGPGCDPHRPRRVGAARRRGGR